MWSYVRVFAIISTIAASASVLPGGVRRQVEHPVQRQVDLASVDSVSDLPGGVRRVEPTGLIANDETPQQSRSKSKPDRHTLTAYCLFGDVRTFPITGDSLANFLRSTDGVGMKQNNMPDLFMYLGLHDDPTYTSYVAQNHSREELDRLEKLLQPVNVKYDSSRGDVSPDSVYTYVAEERCFNETGWNEQHPTFGTAWKDRTRFARSINQLHHIKQCLEMIKEHEVSNNKQYSVVAIARPDMKYGEVFEPSLFASVAASGFVLANGDSILVFKRALMNNFFTRTDPIQCKHGEACCGRIARSEDLWAYILGIRDKCRCANEDVPGHRSDLLARVAVNLCRPGKPNTCVPVVLPEDKRRENLAKVF